MPKKALAFIVLLAMVLTGTLFAQTSGGPDTFGYVWKNSNDANGPDYSWIEPSTTNEVTGLTDDSSSDPIQIGFNFNFYDAQYSELYVSSNGHLTFGTGSTAYMNAAIPGTATPNDLIAWFWNDMNPTYAWANAHIFYQNQTVGGVDAFIISFMNYPEFGGTTYPDDCLQAQVVLFENGNILMQYDWFGTGLTLDGATIGIENIDGTDGLQYCYNDATNLADDLAIMFYRPIPVDNDLMAISITAPEETAVGVPTEFDITIKNRGAVAQNSFQVRLYRENNTLLATTNVNETLNPDQIETYTVTYTPVAPDAGTLIVYGQAYLANDENNINDNTGMLSIYVNAEIDMSAESLTGPSATALNVPTTYTIEVKNNGQAVDGYTVNLMQSNGNVLASAAINQYLPNNAIAYHDLTFTPAAEGSIIIFGNVTLAGDGITENNNTDNLEVVVMPAGTSEVQIGNGTTTANTLPVNYYWWNSLTQVIYYADEFAPFSGGDINYIKYYYNFTNGEIPVYSDITVWMAETTATDFANGWLPVDREAFVQVYEGAPEYTLGEGELLLPFDEPFTYTGNGNVVVMVRRADPADYYSSNDMFYYEETPNHPDRAIEFHQDGADNAPDIYNPPAPSSVLARVPNTTFGMVVEDMGSMQGLCTSGGNPLEGVTVTAENVRYTATSDANGNYYFPFMNPGTYDVTASKFGYYSVTEDNVVITANNEATVNFTLAPLENVTVIGHVVKSDTGENAVGAEISLIGYENYVGYVTDANGNFSIPNVYSNHEYALVIEYEGYEETTIMVQIGTVNPTDLGTVMVNEIAFPPFDMVATQDAGETVANLIWHSPSLTMDNFFDFEDDNGEFVVTQGMWEWGEDAAGAYSGTKVWSTYLNADYEPSSNLILDSPEMRVGNDYVLTFYQWKEMEAFWDGGNVSISVDGGSTWTLMTPVEGYDGTAIGLGGEECYTGTSNGWLLATFDLAAYEQTDAMFRWHFGSDSSVQYDGWMIDDVRVGRVEDLRNGTRFVHADANRVLIDYTVYRLMLGTENDETSWTEVATVADTVYADNSWNAVTAGLYKYAVKANYTNGVQSDADISNWLPKNMTAETVTFNVTTNIGTTPTGAAIHIVCTTATPDDEFPVYDGVVGTNGSAILNGVWKGTYNGTISLTGFVTYELQIVIDEDSETFTVELIEDPLPPSGVTAVANAADTEVTVSWFTPGGGSVGSLLVVDDDGSAYLEFTDTQLIYQNLFTEMGLTFEIYEITEDGADGPDAAYMSNFSTVLWECGEQWSLGRTLSETDEANLASYIDAGGKVVISACDYFYDRYSSAGTFGTTSFPYEYLGLASAEQDAFTVGESQGGPAQVDIVGDGYTNGLTVGLIDIFSAVRDGVYLDFLTPNQDGEAFSTYDGNIIAVQTDNTIVTTANLASMVDSDNTVMEYLFAALSFSGSRKAESSTSALRNEVRELERDANRDVVDYTIYRLIQGNENNPNTWTTIETVGANDTTSVDTGWEDIDTGIFKWAVIANYAFDNHSDPAFSNVVYKNMHAEVTVNLSTNSGDSPVGAELTLSNVNEPEYVYEAVATSGTVVFPEVWHGTYILTVEKDAFNEYSSASTVINDEEYTFTVQLIETLEVISDLNAVNQDEGILLTWLEPGAALPAEFRYDDGVVTGQLGATGGGENVLLGAAHFHIARIEEVSWYLTAEGGPHNEVKIFILGLDGNGMPDVTNILHQSDFQPNTDDEWNIYTLDDPIEAENGFFIAVNTPGQFTAIGLDDGVGEPYDFVTGTQFATLDWTAGNDGWIDIESVGFPQNFTIRAFGLDYGPIETRQSNVTVSEKQRVSNLFSSTADGYETKAVTRRTTERVLDKIVNSGSRSLTGYKVWRGTTLLTTTPITETQYFDDDDALVPGQEYTYSVKAIYSTGESEAITVTIIYIPQTGTNDNPLVPEVTALKGNYPNPFNPVTNISFSLKEDANVTIEIYNIKGQKVKVLVNETMEAGNHNLTWNGNDDFGKPATSGVYFYQMTSGKYTSTKKMLLLK